LSFPTTTTATTTTTTSITSQPTKQTKQDKIERQSRKHTQTHTHEDYNKTIMATYYNNNYVNTFEHDVNVSLKDKCSVLKMLQTILSNLADPVKSQDPKYRQLRLGNAKIRSMASHIPILSLLRSVGFQSTKSPLEEGGGGDDNILQIAVSFNPTPMASQVLSAVTAAYTRVAAHQLQRSGSSNVSSSASTTSSSTTGNGFGGDEPPLTEKQKARLLLEQKELHDKEEARLARKRTSAQIKADKLVRETDPNWKPSVNAAAAKTGSSISTFRDRYGEN
jgi:hypothetical protein